MFLTLPWARAMPVCSTSFNVLPASWSMRALCTNRRRVGEPRMCATGEEEQEKGRILCLQVNTRKRKKVPRQQRRSLARTFTIFLLCFQFSPYPPSHGNETKTKKRIRDLRDGPEGWSDGDVRVLGISPACSAEYFPHFPRLQCSSSGPSYPVKKP